LKLDLDTTARVLLPLYEHIWETEKMADDRKEGLLEKIPKRGDLCECKNTLLSVPNKVFTRILLNRIK
jgi:hypothetical protein